MSERVLSFRVHREPIVLSRDAVSVLPDECVRALWVVSESCEVHLTPDELTITPVTTEVFEVRSRGWVTYIIPCGRIRRVRVVMIDYSPAGPEALFRVFDVEREGLDVVVGEVKRVLSEELKRLKGRRREACEAELSELINRLKEWLRRAVEG